MSSPAGSLKKTRRSPLPASYNSNVPFRRQLFVDTTTWITSKNFSPNREEMITSQHGRIVEEIWREGTGGRGRRGGALSDVDLVTSMAARLAQVERELLAARREILEKDTRIKQLEEQTTILKASSSSFHSTSELQQRCLALQEQVDEMEEFLNDYGMVWVGRERRGGGGGGGGGRDQWLPASSIAEQKGDENFTINFDKIVKNIQELNVLAGEGSAHIQHTPNGAHLTTPPPVPLTLYRNGLVMFAGPFRPYTDPSTQQCIQDLMDGYFPTELQQRYPDGVPFRLVDKRDTEYQSRWSEDLFPGSGQKLGGIGGRGGDRGQLVRSIADRATTSLPAQQGYPQLSIDSFLSRIPKVVIREGRVIDIHTGLAETLKGSAGHMTLVDTPVVQEMRERLECSDSRPPTPGQLVTLRVKSENGEETYILKLRATDTVGDIRTHINRIRSPSLSHDYLIYCSYPRKALSKNSATLEECSITPSANLFLARPQKDKYTTHTHHMQ